MSSSVSKTVHEEAIECSTRLRTLAGDHRFAARSSDLELLADEIDDPDQGSWSGIDLIRAFPPNSTVSAHSRGTLEGVLGVLATVAVFAPVAWTWYSLRAASAAYGDLLAAGGGSGETFLSLWITGFDGRLADIHTLIFVAGVSVVLILLAVSMLIAQHTVARVSTVREEQRALVAENELASTLTQAQRVLNARRAENPTELESLVKRSVQQLDAAHTATRKGAEDLRTAVGKSSQLLSPLLTRLGDASRDVQQALQLAEQSEKQLSGSILKHEAGISQSLATLTAGVTKALEGIDVETRSTAQRSQQLTAQATKSNTEIAAEMAKLTTLIERLDAALERHDSALQAQASELTATRDAAERMLDKLMISSGRHAYA